MKEEKADTVIERIAQNDTGSIKVGLGQPSIIYRNVKEDLKKCE